MSRTHAAPDRRTHQDVRPEARPGPLPAGDLVRLSCVPQEKGDVDAGAHASHLAPQTLH